MGYASYLEDIDRLLTAGRFAGSLDDRPSRRREPAPAPVLDKAAYFRNLYGFRTELVRMVSKAESARSDLDDLRGSVLSKITIASRRADECREKLRQAEARLASRQDKDLQGFKGLTERAMLEADRLQSELAEAICGLRDRHSEAVKAARTSRGFPRRIKLILGTVRSMMPPPLPQDLLDDAKDLINDCERKCDGFGNLIEWIVATSEDLARRTSRLIDELSNKRAELCALRDRISDKRRAMAMRGRRGGRGASSPSRRS